MHTVTGSIAYGYRLGPAQYFRDKWNCFDFFLVLVSGATVVGTAVTFFLGGEYGSLNLSYVRSMRVLRLARYSRSVRPLLHVNPTPAPNPNHDPSMVSCGWGWTGGVRQMTNSSRGLP